MQYLKVVFAISLLFTIILSGITVPSAGNEPSPDSKITTAGAGSFSDVNPEHWAYKPVMRMAERNILNGYPDGSFKPQQLVSRSEFAAMLNSAAGLSVNEVNENQFADCPEDAWFYQAAVAVARYLPGNVKQNGKTYFLPYDDATREDVVVALVKLLDADIRDINPGILQEIFTDYNQINETAIVPMAWAYQNNLLRGFPDGTLKPGDGISRAEVASLLHRAFFIDTTIEGLLAGRQIQPLNDSDREYSYLTTVLQSKYGEINPGSAQGYSIEYKVRKVSLYEGEGPEVLYVFGNLEPRYHSWEADFKHHHAAVQQFVEAVARETARQYPRDTIVVLLGHQIKFLFDVSGVFEGTYLSGSADGWHLERFYSGVMFNNGTVLDTWSEN